MQSTLIGLLSLGIIILIHELGHYFAAKHYKVQVDEFAIGIGPKIFGFNWHNTLWSIRLLPLGGFCRMKSPEIDTTNIDKHSLIPQEEGTLNALSFRAKAIILIAGPFANLVLFIMFSLLLFALGETQFELKPHIDPIQEPATRFLEQGDLITDFNNNPIVSYQDIVEMSSRYIGQEVILTIIRNDAQRTITIPLNDTFPTLGVIPYIAPIVSNTSQSTSYGFKQSDIIQKINGKELTNAIEIDRIIRDYDTKFPISVTVKRNGEIKKFELLIQDNDDIFQLLGIDYGFVEVQSWNSFGEFIQVRTNTALTILNSTVFFFVDLLKLNTKKLAENTAGPIRLISIVGSSTVSNAQEYGWVFALIGFINITSILSIAIGSLNLLPIPILDGGQLLFYFIHRVQKKQPKIKSFMKYNSTGMVIMLLLFLFVVFSDIKSFF